MSQLKAKKCNTCERNDSELMKLPSGKYICSVCIDEFPGNNENDTPQADQQLDDIDPISFFQRTIFAHRQSAVTDRLCESREAKLNRIRQKLVDFQLDFDNYSTRIKRTIDVTRYFLRPLSLVEFFFFLKKYCY